MKITVGKLRDLVREAISYKKSDPRVDAGRFSRDRAKVDSNPELTVLKNEIRDQKTMITKFTKMERAGKRHGQDLGVMRAHLAELEQRLAAMTDADK